MNSEKIDTKVSPELKEKLKASAKKTGRSFSGHLRFVLEQSEGMGDMTSKPQPKIQI